YSITAVSYFYLLGSCQNCITDWKKRKETESNQQLNCCYLHKCKFSTKKCKSYMTEHNFPSRQPQYNSMDMENTSPRNMLATVSYNFMKMIKETLHVDV